MNETDLRVIKTRESIEQAFLKLLEKKTPEKITVVELAREARINKGTFYLHYQDVFDLYDKTVKRKMEENFSDADYFAEFFDDPQSFCRKLNAAFSASIPVMAALTRGKGSHSMLPQTLDLLRGKIYETGRIRASVYNDIRLDALFSALLICKPRYEKQHSMEMDRYMLELIAGFHGE